eukprot:g32140.t2
MSVCLAPLSLHEALALPKCKQGECEQREATEIFQEIQAAYEELATRLDAKGAIASVGRVRSSLAAACELGDVEAVRRLLAEDPPAASEPDDLGASNVFIVTILEKQIKVARWKSASCFWPRRPPWRASPCWAGRHSPGPPCGSGRR